MVDVDDFIPMGKRVDESFPPSEIRNLEFYKITRDFENLAEPVGNSLFFKILNRQFSFLEIVKMKLENPIYESDPYLADFKPDLDRRHAKMTKTISSIEGNRANRF